MTHHQSPYVNKRKKCIEFHIKNACANTVALVGDFNNWTHGQLTLRQSKNGFWSIEIPMLPRGKYHYKFFIDDRMWAEDIENQYREPDGVAGWNSILEV